MLREYQSYIIKDNFSLRTKEKRIPNLGNIRKWKLHYKNLKLYFSLGLELKKVLEY